MEKTVPAVVRAALAATDDEWRRWEVVQALRDCGEVAFEAARDLCASAEGVERELGVDILAQLGVTLDQPATEGPWREAVVDVLLGLAPNERAPAMLNSLAAAFGHREDPRGFDPLQRWSTHTDAEVRRSVASALCGWPQRSALHVLIGLSADADAGVRDWATFGLARQTDEDFPELREALAARLDDSDVDTHLEALHGLSTRVDDRAMQPLLDALTEASPEVGDLLLLDEALFAQAAATGDPRLCPHVEARWQSWLADLPDEDAPDDLCAAHSRCRVA